MARGDEGFDLVHLDAEVVRIDAHFNVHLLSSRRKSELVSELPIGNGRVSASP